MNLESITQAQINESMRVPPKRTPMRIVDLSLRARYDAVGAYFWRGHLTHAELRAPRRGSIHVPWIRFLTEWKPDPNRPWPDETRRVAYVQGLKTWRH